MSPRVRRRLFPIVSVAAVLLLMGNFGLRQDELQCAEALTHVIDCCPDFNTNTTMTSRDAMSLCRYSDACDERFPVLEVGQSRCLQELDCAAMRSQGVCARMQAAVDGGQMRFTGVCP